MSLALYSRFLQFPGGGPASNYPVPVLPMGSNQPASLFTNQSGTVQASNPVTTDAEGQVVFWAAPGCYDVHLAGEHIRIPLDESFTDPVWPDLVVHQQASPASVWTVTHHFGVKPSVTLLVDGTVAEAQVSHPNDTTTVITLSQPVTGQALLRR